MLKKKQSRQRKNWNLIKQKKVRPRKNPKQLLMQNNRKRMRKKLRVGLSRHLLKRLRHLRKTIVMILNHRGLLPKGLRLMRRVQKKKAVKKLKPAGTPLMRRRNLQSRGR